MHIESDIKYYAGILGCIWGLMMGDPKLDPNAKIILANTIDTMYLLMVDFPRTESNLFMPEEVMSVRKLLDALIGYHDWCMDYLNKNKEEQFDETYNALDLFRMKITHLEIMCKGDPNG